ncbi:MAG: hypothetical protein REI78_02915 [Pedobacter sp.]|nr:hypothetical protein [Pedobacter sp.]
MPDRKKRKASEHLHSALVLEREKDYSGAIALYLKAVKADPSNPQGWNRLMIAYRRTKTQLQEAALIKEAIENYQTAIKSAQNDWIADNKEKIEGSRELAKVMGLLDNEGLPKNTDQTVEKWQTRLYLLEYRIRAKKKKADSKKAKIKRPVNKPSTPKARPKPRPAAKTHTKPAKKKPQKQKAP